MNRKMVFLGAGAVKPFGVPLGDEILKELCSDKNDFDYYINERDIPHCKRYNAKRVIKTLFNYEYWKDYGFEALLNELENLFYYYRDITDDTTLTNRKFRKSSHFLKPQSFIAESCLNELELRALLHECISKSYSKINNKVTIKEKNLSDFLCKNKRTFFKKSKRFYKYLAKKQSPVSIYSLNYDNLFSEKLNKKFFDGFSREKGENNYDNDLRNINPFYEPKSDAILNNIKKNIFINLHGSTSFFIDSDMNHFVKLEDNTRFLNSINLHSNRDCEESNHVFYQGLRIPIIAGYRKLERLQIEPFQSFRTRLYLDSYDTSTIITIGYSFGDPHINTIIFNIMNTNKDAKLLIVDRSADKPNSLIVNYLQVNGIIGENEILKSHDNKNLFRNDKRNCWYYNNGVEDFFKEYEEIIGELD